LQLRESGGEWQVFSSSDMAIVFAPTMD
jgi:hypothetical protein